MTGNGDWIEWAGGECPVADPYNVKVEVELRDGGRNSFEAYGYDWSHQPDGQGPRDIIAYRVVKS